MTQRRRFPRPLRGPARRPLNRPLWRPAIALAATTAVVLAGGYALLRDPGPTHELTRQSDDSGGAGRSGAGRGGGPLTPVAVDPAEFHPGSCVTYPPSGGKPRDKTVFIDAGHGGPDPGGVGVTSRGGQVSEAQVNLPTEMAAMRALTGDGYRVVVSRTAPGTVLKLGPGDTSDGLLTLSGAHADIAARSRCANEAHADLLIGVYMNAGFFGGAGSVTVYDAVRPFWRASERFASLLQSDVLRQLNQAGYGIPDGGVSRDSGMGSTLTASGASYGHLLLLGPAKRGYFDAPSKMPGALIEPLFITDPFEASIAASSRGQRLIADGIARAVAQYFSRPVRG